MMNTHLLRPSSSCWVQRLVLGFVLLTCVRVWTGPLPVLETAYGQIPDAALQRKQLLDEAKMTNQLLADIKHALTAETLHVRLEGADNQVAPGTSRGVKP
jgi:hypothetical protein